MPTALRVVDRKRSILLRMVDPVRLFACFQKEKWDCLCCEQLDFDVIIGCLFACLTSVMPPCFKLFDGF